MPAQVRWFFAPAANGAWELFEARKRDGGWDLRRPGKFGARTVPTVPPAGEDWVEAHAPPRAPKPRAAPAEPEPVKAKAVPVRVVVKGEAAAEAKPRMVPERPARKPGARHTKPMPSLSRELLGLMADAQRDQPVPAGKAKCPLCGAIVEPMKVRKVRTHDNPLTGQRCPASGQSTA